ncbi:MAG TPA: UDP-N-acetylglucosamine 2-epimerase (non-hydrolyzing) [Gemmatimonadales bacterium]|nr:UDP-N-acetylglucosamine 2-epimerase (non-hydrolyzing) [Gemmatimonadales bacterium]
MTGPIALCYGTRPQVIKASVLRRALAAIAPVAAIDTGQHYDYALNQLLYDQLGVAAPDHCLEVGSASHATQTAGILVRAEALYASLAPRIVVVIGDTNSTLGCALAAAKLRIPVVHVEAGLRAEDALMAEEINRRVVDAIGSLLCTPSGAATARMRAEHPAALVAETGDVARDVLLAQLEKLPDVSALVPPSDRGEYAFATLHRAELTDRPDRLVALLGTLAGLPLPVLLAMHPRTRAALEAHGHRVGDQGSLTVVPAVGYLESLALTARARLVITDSGGVQREAYWLGVPCLTMRTETEWMETVELGANRLLPPADAAGLAAAVEERLASPRAWDRDAYGKGDASERVAFGVATLLNGGPAR